MACREYKPTLNGLGLPPEEVDSILKAMLGPVGPTAATPKVAAPAPAKPQTQVTQTAPPLVKPRPEPVAKPPPPPPPAVVQKKPGILGPLAAGAGAGFLVGGPVGLVVGAAGGLAVALTRK